MTYIGVDVGGTFTDSVAIDGSGRVVIGKAPTTPKNVADGVMASLTDLAGKCSLDGLPALLSQANFIGHGTTVGTNALLTRSGAKVGLLITAGFEQTPYIQRAIGRIAGLSEEEQRFQVSIRQPKPLIERSHIVGVLERVDSNGTVIVPLSEAEAERAVRALLDQGVEAVAICLLWSFLNPAHEQLLTRTLNRLAPDLPISVSSDLVPKIRENARCNTVVIDAYVRGRVHDYLVALHTRLADSGFRRSVATMQCFGGVSDSQHVHAISTMDSGPVGGVMASKYLARQLGEPNVITTDVGGTSFDVSAICNDQEMIKREYFGSAGVMSRFEVLLPRVDIQSTGAGGGSIAWFDRSTRTIKLGPKSAGSDPGPVFYGRGGMAPTVADAWLILGYLDPDNFLDGRITVDMAAAFAAIDRDLAKPLGMTVPEAASAIVQLANNHMSDAIKVFMTSHGLDTREYVMFAFGGGGPLHAAAYGALSGVKKTYLLSNAGVLSAFGIALADMKHRQERTMLQREPFNIPALLEAMTGLEDRLHEQFEREGLRPAAVTLRHFLEMRYRGQIHEITVEIPGKEWMAAAQLPTLKARFSEQYGKVYSSSAESAFSEIEITGVVIEGQADSAKPSVRRESKTANGAAPSAKMRSAYFPDRKGYRDIPVHSYASLAEGQVLQGPLIVQGQYLTMLVNPGQTAVVDGFGNLVIDHSLDR
jgi:N-methylhydantoinase A